jgi:hypothetical protein
VNLFSVGMESEDPNPCPKCEAKGGRIQEPKDPRKGAIYATPEKKLHDLPDFSPFKIGTFQKSPNRLTQHPTPSPNPSKV